jgi:formate dehydrogenase major subunit
MVLCALGQRPDGGLLVTEDIGVAAGGAALVQEDTGATNLPGVFAAGDAAGRPASVIEAVADGRRVAAAIGRFLAGEPLAPPRAAAEPTPVAAQAALARHIETPDAPRVAIREAEPAARVRSFDEVARPLTEDEARLEAQRCLACGCGVGCGLCEKVCIYAAIQPQGGRFVVDGEKCDGCGLCVVRCAHQAIEMVSRDA